MAWLVSQGISPSRIMLLTFTRRASDEMLRRARTALSETGSSTLGTVWGGTFHSVGNRLLRTYGEAIGLDPDFTVMVEAVNPSAALQETLFQAPHCSLAGSMSCNPTNARCFDLDRLCNDMHGFRSFLIMVIQHWRANVVSVFAWSRALQERAFSLFPRD
jgi:hypothetical protein